MIGRVYRYSRDITKEQQQKNKLDQNKVIRDNLKVTIIVIKTPTIL